MPSIPTWLIGKNVTAISAVAQQVNATTGALTNLTVNGTTTFVMTGQLDEITPTSTNDTENIVPLDVRQNNEVIVGSGTSLTLVEILNQSLYAAGPPVTGGNVLLLIAFAADYVYITFTRGGTTFSGYFVVGEYAQSLRRGKSVGTLTLKPCGISVSD
jgi:hypothetical protein